MMDEKPREFFYTATPVIKRVSHDEFVEFVKHYPRKLYVDVCGISDPPTISYNDFELANRWPYSIVAHTYAYDDNPNGYFYMAEKDREYKIVENYDVLYTSKTGNQA